MELYQKLCSDIELFGILRNIIWNFKGNHMEYYQEYHTELHRTQSNICCICWPSVGAQVLASTIQGRPLQEKLQSR